MIVRLAQPADLPAIRAVHTAAFGSPDSSAAEPAEARLVDDLLAEGSVAEELSLVAQGDGSVIGHVICSRGMLGDQPFLGLGPLGVLPAYQSRGAGQALMHAVLGAADALGEPGVALLGSPAYYGRFGFVRSTEHDVDPPDPEWAEHFQVRTLTGWRPGDRRTFRYAPAFDRL